MAVKFVTPARSRRGTKRIVTIGSLAAVLIGMNERAFLRDLRAGSPPEQIEQTVTALVDAWASTLYRDLG